MTGLGTSNTDGIWQAGAFASSSLPHPESMAAAQPGQQAQPPTLAAVHAAMSCAVQQGSSDSGEAGKQTPVAAASTGMLEDDDVGELVSFAANAIVGPAAPPPVQHVVSVCAVTDPVTNTKVRPRHVRTQVPHHDAR